MRGNSRRALGDAGGHDRLVRPPDNSVLATSPLSGSPVHRLHDRLRASHTPSVPPVRWTGAQRTTLILGSSAALWGAIALAVRFLL